MIKIVRSQLDHTNSLRLLGSVVCGRHRQVVKFVGGPYVAVMSVALLCSKIAFSLARRTGEIRNEGNPTAGDDLRKNFA